MMRLSRMVRDSRLECCSAFAKKTLPFDVWLHNFVSANNLGGSVRAAECAGARHVYHHGKRSLEEKRSKKASLGAEASVACSRVEAPESFLETWQQRNSGTVLIIDPLAPKVLSDYLEAIEVLPESFLLIFPSELPGKEPWLEGAQRVASTHSAVSPALVIPNKCSQVAAAVYHVAAVLEEGGKGASLEDRVQGGGGGGVDVKGA